MNCHKLYLEFDYLNFATIATMVHIECETDAGVGFHYRGKVEGEADGKLQEFHFMSFVADLQLHTVVRKCIFGRRTWQQTWWFGAKLAESRMMSVPTLKRSVCDSVSVCGSVSVCVWLSFCVFSSVFDMIVSSIDWYNCLFTLRSV